MKALTIIIVSLVLSACSALPTLSTVAPTFCSLASNAESQKAALDLMDKMPPGTDKDKAMTALRMAEVSADAACILVKVLEAQASTAK